MTAEQHGFARADALVGEAIAALAELRITEAGDLLDIAAAVFEAAAGPEHPEVAHCLLVRARVARDAGRLDDARRDADRAVDIAVRASARGDADLRAALARLEAQARGERAAVALAESELEAAEADLRTALDLVTAACGPSDPEVAALENQLGQVHHGQGRLHAAERRWRHGLAILERACDGAHVERELATVYGSLAALRSGRGHADEAGVLLARAVALAEGRLGGGHPAEAEIEEPPRRGLAALRAAVGDRHLDIGVTRSCLGAVLDAQDRLAEAAAELSIALAGQEASLGPAHADVGLTLYRLARVRLREGRLPEATALCSRAVAATTAALGAEHPHATAARALARTIDGARARGGERPQASPRSPSTQHRS